MAAEIVHIIDPDNGSGTHYTSLSAWEAAQQRDLPTADEIAVATCRSSGGTADTTAFTIGSAWTTDATGYIKIWTDTGESHRHDGTWSSGKARMVVPDCINIDEVNYVKIIGMQFDLTGGSGDQFCIRVDPLNTESSKIEILKCLFTGTTSGGSGTQAAAVFVDETTAGAADVFVTNCIAFDMYNSDYPDSSSVTAGFYCKYGNLYAYNCTAFSCRTGFANGSYNFYAKNCLSNCDDENANYEDFKGSFDAGTTNNASSDATAPGANEQTNQTFTFTDESTDDYHLAEGDTGARGLGLDLSGDGSYPITDDVDDDTRSAWDIGADEFAAPPAGLSIPIAMHHYQHHLGV